MSDAVKETVNSLPDAPGIYRFYDRDNVLIYVGKAKSLKKRVSSYFNKQSQYNRKTERLVSEIKHIEFTLANTEFDALLMENNFIKQNQPKYNILLKDDKTFPYLCILHEPFPRIISTRKYIAKQGSYFGPYSSVVSMKSVLELVRKLYSIRTCNLLLTPENINSGKFKVCLEYHLGNCKGPCIGAQEEQAYLEDIRMARSILKGNLTIVEEYFTTQMKSNADALNFERAEFFKNKLLLLEKFQAKSLVVNRKLTDIDVVTITSTPTDAFVNFLQVREGAIIFSKNVEVKKKLDEPDDEILGMVTQQLRLETQSNHSIIFSNIPLPIQDPSFENIVPVIGDKKKLVDLSLKNVLYLKSKKEVAREEAKIKNESLLRGLQQDLQLLKLPRIIECFDNSNLQGTHPVASMVRFVDGKPDKRGYRHFNIKTVEGPDDFASMKEIVGRRYKRLLEEDAELPNLIIVDGGKGQLSSAVEVLKELDLYGRVPIIGIAKRLEEIYYPHDPLPLHIGKKSPSLLLIQYIRDEAHRFAITFHRLKRSSDNLDSEMDNIPGIGKKTADLLLANFKSARKLRDVSFEELERLVGKAKASKVRDWQQKREPD